MPGQSAACLRHGSTAARGRPLAQLQREEGSFRREVEKFLDGLISHYVLDEGRLVVAHAGLAERMHGRASGRVRSFCLYGQTTGETDAYGLPVRYPWAEDYRGRAMVLYGHTPVPATEWVNNTMCLDTGCVFGGRLTAFNYPERTHRSVAASRVYYQPTKPLDPAAGRPASASGRDPGVLDIRDVSGVRAGRPPAVSWCGYPRARASAGPGRATWGPGAASRPLAGRGGRLGPGR